MVREIITDRFDGMAVRYVENPDYATSNSMLSLALGLEGVNRPTWVLEGDVIFDPAILALSAKAPISWFADSSTHHLDGAYIECGPDNLAVSLDIVRDMSALRAGQLKSMGILHLSQAGVKNVRQWLARGVRDGRQNDYYDLILRDHLGSNLVQVVDVAGHRWFEIDSNEDLNCASALFS
jgi:choline kinase